MAFPSRQWRWAAAAAGAIALVLVAGAWGLSRGPLQADVLRPLAERWLSSRVKGGRARIAHVGVAWFEGFGSIGLQIDGVSLDDGLGRPVLRARQAEAGLALASLARLEPSPGVLGARDFFAAVSVSPQGRYQLGYDAAGAPERGGGDLWLYIDDLKGPARHGRPLSYLRRLALDNGRVAMRQVGGPVAWIGEVRRVHLAKTGGRLEARADMRVGEATLNLDAAGSLGLKRGRVRMQLARLVPAAVFPWVGPTRVLSVLNAPVGGRASAQWATDQGVQSADLSLAAGQGRVRLSGAPTPFQSGLFEASYDPRSSQVQIRALRLDAAQAALDASGRLWLEPEGRNQPARLRLELNAPHGRLSLSSKNPPVPIEGLVLRTSYVARTGRLALEQFAVRVAGAPLSLSGQLIRPRDARSWGISLDGRLDGEVGPRTVTAFWPDELSSDVRDWLDTHVSGGRFGHAVLHVSLAPGESVPHRPLPNGALKLTYLYQDAAVTLLDQAPPIEHIQGETVMLGDRFDMTVRSAEVEGVRLGNGTLEIPRLMGAGKRLKVAAHALGEARAILDVADRHTGGAARSHGFDPNNVTGRGDVVFSVSRSLDDRPDWRAHYAGWVRDGVIADAMLGSTLKTSALKVDGALDHVTIQGPVQLGPYRGPLTYTAEFPDGKGMAQKAEFDGLVDVAGLGLSGPVGSTLKFAARIENRATGGRASLRSPGFSGDVEWSGANRVAAQGVADAAALRGVGVPIAHGVPARLPVRLTLARSGLSWSGGLEADAYSGDIAFTDGPDRKLRYSAQLTPAEAQKLGFTTGSPQTLTLDLTMSGESGSAAYGFGPWSGQVGWTQAEGGRTQYRWRALLTPADLHSLGLPAGVQPRVSVPIDVTMSNSSGAWNGSAEIAGGSFRFSASPPVNGFRRVNLGGGLDGAMLANLGLTPQGLIAGPASFSGALELGPDGLKGGHVEGDLQKAAVTAPYVRWKKAAGRAMRLTVDFARTGEGGWQASAIRGEGPGFGLKGSGTWTRSAGAGLHLADAKLEGAFEGALDLSTDDEGTRLATRARYFDARRLIQEGGQAAERQVSGRTAAAAAERPLTLDVQLAQVRVSDTALVRNVRINGVMGGDKRRPMDLTVARDDGAVLIALRLTPDDAGAAISGKVTDIGEATQAIFGQRLFRGGQGQVNGRLTPGGADLQVEASHVRLVQTPGLAKILTIGSLRGMADQLNGAGIEFTKVSAPLSIRGARLTIGRSRATGPAMGITTQGVIDAEAHTVDLAGNIAPSYVLNSAMGSAPLIGALMAPHKGEGLFGLTYSARGSFSQPRISVNPFSLAAPGILRRIFESRSEAAISKAEGG